MNLEDLESKFDIDYRDYIFEYKVDYEYGFDYYLFINEYLENYYIDITLEHNKNQINDVIIIVEKKINDELLSFKNDYEEDQDLYLEILSTKEDTEIYDCLINAFRSKNLSIFSDYYPDGIETFYKNAIENLKYIKEASYEFFDDCPRKIITAVFEE